MRAISSQRVARVEQSIIASSALDISVPVPTGVSEALRELTEHAARRKADDLAATLAERALRLDDAGAPVAAARSLSDFTLPRPSAVLDWW